VNRDTKLLLRYLDGEMLPGEAHGFRARLAESPALRQRLQQMQRVGALVRIWAGSAEERAGDLVVATLKRVQQAERRRARNTTLGYVLAAALIIGLPWARRAPELAAAPSELAKPAGAAIERIEAGDKQARVFVVGSSSTPVVWLADEAQEDDATGEPGPG
jgi:anti-sigma factor RsiW